MKDLCLVTGGDDAVDIVSFMVPNMEGLHMEGSTTDRLFPSAAVKHRGLERLAIALDEEENVEVEAFNPKALGRIMEAFSALDTLVLHESPRPGARRVYVWSPHEGSL
jgi:hypothetical protein